MKEYTKLTKNNLPADGAIVTLSDGERHIQAKFHNGKEIAFTWIPRQNEQGICLMTNPTHWK